MREVGRVNVIGCCVSWGRIIMMVGGSGGAERGRRRATPILDVFKEHTIYNTSCEL